MPSCEVKWELMTRERDLSRLKDAAKNGQTAPNFNETLANLKKLKLPENDVNHLFDADYVTRPNTAIWEPSNCKSEEDGKTMEIAIIICYREREHQLKYLMYYLFPLLQKQKQTFSIYLVEQGFENESESSQGLFNRAKLFNVGYAEAIKENPNFNCFTFHDVDLILENENVTYSCDWKNPRHLTSSISKFNYKILPNKKMFGGVSQMTFEQLNKVNGYANTFWGWGGEDDQMFARLNYARYGLTRPGYESRWFMIPHAHEKTNNPNPYRKQQVKSTGPKHWAADGISSLKYKVLEKKVEEGSMFTRIVADIFAPFDMDEAYEEFKNVLGDGQAQKSSSEKETRETSEEEEITVELNNDPWKV